MSKVLLLHIPATESYRSLSLYSDGSYRSLSLYSDGSCSLGDWETDWNWLERDETLYIWKEGDPIWHTKDRPHHLPRYYQEFYKNFIVERELKLHDV